MPYGGKYQLTPTQAMAAKIPVLKGQTKTCSIMGWGYNPYVSDKSPYHGAIAAVIESISKVIAAGGSYKQCWLTFQEYFERTQNNPTRWGKPFSALLGAYKAQIELGCGAIGGKDSMSGTFENIDVPATLVSFAVSTADSGKILSPEFKKAGNKVIYITPDYDENGLPKWDSVRSVFDRVEKIIAEGKALSVWSVGFGGIAEAVAKMSLGNRVGFKFDKKLSSDLLFYSRYGSFVIELDGDPFTPETVIGTTTDSYTIDCKDYVIDMADLQKSWRTSLNPYSPATSRPRASLQRYTPTPQRTLFSTLPPLQSQRCLSPYSPAQTASTILPVYLSVQAQFPRSVVIKNLSAQTLEESVKYFEKAVKKSQDRYDPRRLLRRRRA